MTFDEFAKAVMMNTIGKAYPDFPTDLKFINEDFFNAIDIDGMYRVTIQVVKKLPLTSKQKFCFSTRPMY